MNTPEVPLTGELANPTESTAIAASLDATAEMAALPRRYPPITIKIASTRAEREAAFRLVYQRYLASGLCAANPHGMRVTPYHLLPTTTVFVAIYRGEVILAVSLIGDGGEGVPMESIFPEEIQNLRNQGVRFGEISCL